MRRSLSSPVHVVELPDFDGAFIEIVEQAGVDAHLTEVLAKRLPVGAAAAGRAVVNADHSVTPDIGHRLTGYAHLLRREIGDPPGQPAAQRAIAVRNPFGRPRQLNPNLAAVTASINAHARSLVGIWEWPQLGGIPKGRFRVRNWNSEHWANDVIWADLGRDAS